MKKYMPYDLFAEPSFVEGMARVIDIGNTLQEYNTSKTDHEADSKALKNDWKMIGGDVKKAMNMYEQELATSA